MNKDFAPFGLAVKLKEKGFREPCIKHYYPNSKDWFISSVLNVIILVVIQTLPPFLKR